MSCLKLQKGAGLGSTLSDLRVLGCEPGPSRAAVGPADGTQFNAHPASLTHCPKQGFLPDISTLEDPTATGFCAGNPKSTEEDRKGEGWRQLPAPQACRTGAAEGGALCRTLKRN